MTDDQIIEKCLAAWSISDGLPNIKRIRREYGIGYSRATRLRAEAEKIIQAREAGRPVIEFDERDNGATLTANVPGRIISAEQLVTAAHVDLRKWRFDRQRVKKWEVVTKDADGEPRITQVFGITVSFLYNKTGAMLTDLFDGVLAEMRDHAPVYPKLSHNIPNSDGWLYVVSVPDAHFGKLAWAAETGENYDVKIAQDVYDKSIGNLLTAADGLQMRRILYIVGNDLLHVDRGANTTTAGTPQDVDGRWQKAYRAAFDSTVRAIEAMREIAPVDVAVQPGNHDRERAWLLGEGLRAWFRLVDDVRVLNQPSPRRYYSLGRVLLGITHGDGEKLKDLPGIMASETGAAWARARRREWLIGHFHRRRHLDSLPLADERGVMVRVLPSLTAADAWHVGKGYYGQRAAAGIAYRLDGLAVRDMTIALAEDERREDGVFVFEAGEMA